MADLATSLLRTAARAFYTTEHVLVVDALVLHSTLQDNDLAHVLGMQTKSLRKLCGRLREDGLISVQTRAEKRADDVPSYFPSYGKDPSKQKERLSHRDWYYLNYHRAIDSVKYHMMKLSRHIEGMGAPTTEKKDLKCPRCKSEYTELEVMDKIDYDTGNFLCHRCGHALDPVEEDERANENESMKRLNIQLAKLLSLMRQIDSTDVPENDFDTALSKQRPVYRGAENPGARMEVVDLPNRNLQSAKGLELKPEKVSVNLQDDETIKRESEAEEARLKREKEARQNALPEWISKSTVSGEITTVGAKEERERVAREAHLGGGALRAESGSEEKKPAAAGGEEDVMAAYWEELARAREVEAAKAREEDEEEEEEEDEDEEEFEDVGGLNVQGGNGNGGTRPSGAATPANGANGANGTGASTPADGAVSSNATDDERDVKRVRLDVPPTSLVQANGVKVGEGAGKLAEDTPGASDEDEDEDDLEFENV